MVPAIRVRAANAAPVHGGGEYVLYWMIAARRAHWNFALQRAAEWARELNRPLVILEALSCNYRWASERLNRFVIAGMADNARAFAGTPVVYYPYVEPSPQAGKGLLAALAAEASVVVTDDFPCADLPALVARAAARVAVRMEQVDSNGLLPLRVADHAFTTAYSFRRFLQRELPSHLASFPEAEPLARLPRKRVARLPKAIQERWPRMTKAALARQVVSPVAVAGGAVAAKAALSEFVAHRLPLYEQLRNHPDSDVSSGLSPYLHFGHISAHQVFSAVMEREGWSVDDLPAGRRADGRREGWWGDLSPSAAAFLDQFITWRELGFNMCALRADFDSYESLPPWALRTLELHARDQRERIYSLEQFERAATHDALWNAAQTQLVRSGRLHNYLRMLWGKKILEWSESPREALRIMVELNNKYALDGRDPNSYSGIFWVLGRYDRPWGPERPVFGTVRYMSSASTARKVRVREYLRKYGEFNEAS